MLILYITTVLVLQTNTSHITMTFRCSPSDLIKAIQNPSLVRHEIGKASFSLEKALINAQFKRRVDSSPINIMERDWDNLIILDACRFDYFKKQNHFKGTLSHVLSAGSESWEFMNHNFVDNKLHDTVYITANPHVDRVPDDTFYMIENLLDQWDSDIEVVHPRDVVSAAIKTYQNHPNKRLIIHFMQPHTPWLGPTADEIRDQYTVKGNNPKHGKDKLGDNVSDPRTGDIGWFELVRRGNISEQEMQQAYSETLDIVLNHVDELLDSLTGKSVITADHGEMLGERTLFRRLWGHYHDLWTSELRYVPWLTIESSQRREIIDSSPRNRERMNQSVINDRLNALGYK